ncbi:DUF4364 family protein [Defluviitalea phaphyphila]|uniref:DUF4364 family protein n=1 Tax=Defluviitalea phaphyphila TaxID=1473580 RepID=UPI00072FEB24|nr:DUF4364 family protein [Defluviitalea phaphyphila]
MFQSSNELAINKLILLYLISKIKMPLSHAQITQFIMEKTYTDYFSLQQYLTELVNADLINKYQENHTTRYIITNKGIMALEYFSSRIPENIRLEIDEYIQKNRQNIKKELEIISEYIPEKSNEYMVYCKVKENDTILMNLQINVASKKQAKLICDNWKKNAPKLYSSILSDLTKNS